MQTSPVGCVFACFLEFRQREVGAVLRHQRLAPHLQWIGEVGAILGDLEEDRDFADLVLDAWLQATEQGRADAFSKLENQLLAARREYDGVKLLDEALFGNELDAA